MKLRLDSTFTKRNSGGLAALQRYILPVKFQHVAHAAGARDDQFFQFTSINQDV